MFQKYFESKLNSITDKIKIIHNWKADYDILNTQVCNLEQRSRLNNGEINGIPEKNGENLIDMLNNMGQELQCPISNNDIDAVH